MKSRTWLSAAFTIRLVETEYFAAAILGRMAAYSGRGAVNARLSRSLIGRGEVDVARTADGQTANVRLTLTQPIEPGTGSEGSVDVLTVITPYPQIIRAMRLRILEIVTAALYHSTSQVLLVQ